MPPSFLRKQESTAALVIPANAGIHGFRLFATLRPE